MTRGAGVPELTTKDQERRSIDDELRCTALTAKMRDRAIGLLRAQRTGVAEQADRRKAHRNRGAAEENSQNHSPVSALRRDGAIHRAVET